MDQPKYVLVKLVTGDTLIGSLVDVESDTHITLNNPFTYQIISITNPFGAKVKDVLTFRKWIDFSGTDDIQFAKTAIISTVPADEKILQFYLKELETLQQLMGSLSDNNNSDEQNPEQEDDTKGIMGNLNLNFNFENPDHFQMFMENMQISIEALLDEIENGGQDNIDDLDISDFEFEDDEEFNPAKANTNPPKRKRAKNRIAPKESFDLPYVEDGDPKDPRSWSNNPEDYLK